MNMHSPLLRFGMAEMFVKIRSDLEIQPSCNRVYYRNALPSNWVDFNVGFRCVKDVKAKN